MVLSKLKKYRTVAFVATVSVLLMILLSFGFIALHINHDCTGDDCGICLVLHNTNSLIKQLFNAPATFKFIFVSVLLALFVLQKSLIKSCNTLISLKVRIND